VFANSGIRSLGDVIPGVRELNVNSFGNALSFGAILGFLAAIFGGWLGGLLAPTQAVAVSRSPYFRPDEMDRKRHAPVEVARRDHTVVEERPRVVPAFGRKGGERVDEDVQTERVERRDVDEVHRSRVQD
jgi:hypothetical protein